MIVITMIGILLVSSGVTYVATLVTTRDGRRKADLENIRTALELYRADNNTYPIDDSYAVLETGSKKYITRPKDPKNNLDYYYRSEACSGGTPNICNSYILAVALEKPPSSVSGFCDHLQINAGGTLVDACLDSTGTVPTTCNYCLDPYGKY